MEARGGMHTLVVTMLLLFFTVVMGLTFGTGLQDRVAAQLELAEGEIIGATMVHRDHTLHVRADVRHVLGSYFDRVAVSEVAAGGASLERDGSRLGTNHSALSYRADGWSAPGGAACSSWTVDVRAWPASWPPASPPACEMHVYQRLGTGGPPDLSDGDTAVLELVVAGVAAPADGGAGVAVEYGRADRTKVTGMADAALYAAP